MITIIYTSVGNNINDFEIQKSIDSLCRRRHDKDSIISISNELFILACRAAVKTGKINHNNIEFIIKGYQYHVNSHGQFIEDIPHDVLNNHNRYLDILLGI